MKPWGMTAAFEIVRPSRLEDTIYDAVESAVSSGMSPTDFFAEAKECWSIALREKAQQDKRELARLNP